MVDDFAILLCWIKVVKNNKNLVFTKQIIKGISQPASDMITVLVFSIESEQLMKLFCHNYL